MRLSYLIKREMDNHYDKYIPVRCYTCNRPIGKYQIEIEKRYDSGESFKEIMDSIYPPLNICCRSNIMNPFITVGHVKIDPPNMQYTTNPNIFIKRWNDDVSSISPKEAEQRTERRVYIAR